MTSEFLADWLVSNHIVEQALGNEVDGVTLDVHVELVKRLPEVRSVACKGRRHHSNSLSRPPPCYP